MNTMNINPTVQTIQALVPDAQEGYIERHTESVKMEFKNAEDRIQQLEKRLTRIRQFLDSPTRAEYIYPNMYCEDDIRDCEHAIDSTKRSIDRLIKEEGAFLI